MSHWITERRREEIIGATLKVGKFRIIVHRHIFYPHDKWLLTCGTLFHTKGLASKNLDEAKCQAVALVQVELETAIKAIIA